MTSRSIDSRELAMAVLAVAVTVARHTDRWPPSVGNLLPHKELRLKDVDQAQQAIVSVAKDLAAKGEIMLADGGADDELIY